MKSIKRLLPYTLSLVIVFALSFPLFADETADNLMKLYKRKKEMHQKYDIMRSVVKRNNPEAVPFLMESLDELNQMGELANKKDEEVKKDLQIMVVQELGDMKATQAGSIIHRTVLNAEDPYLKSEAILSLGKIGDRSYAEEIALTLNDLNTYRGEDIPAEEAIAYGCIRALELLKDPVGYLPVFRSISAGYSRKIQDTARNALNSMVDDPSDILRILVMNEPDLELKVEGLKAVGVSRAPKENKVSVAAAALGQGLMVKSANAGEEASLRELRVRALQLCIELGYSNPDAVKLIEQILYLNTDDNEKVFAIEALKSMKGEESAQALTRYLAYQNSRQESGVTERDNQIIIAIIRALGASGSKAGYQELLRVKFSEYTPAVTREADRAIDMIKNAPETATPPR